MEARCAAVAENCHADADLLAQGWIDRLRHVHPDERIYTFWDYFRQHWQRNAGLRIDHILLNAELAPRLKSAGVDSRVHGEECASDHATVWVELGQVKAAVKRPARKAVAKKTKP